MRFELFLAIQKQNIWRRVLTVDFLKRDELFLCFVGHSPVTVIFGNLVSAMAISA